MKGPRCRMHAMLGIRHTLWGVCHGRRLLSTMQCCPKRVSISRNSTAFYFDLHYLRYMQLTQSSPTHALFNGPPYKNLIPGGTEWRRVLRHCIAMLQASPQTRAWSRAVAQPAMIGSPIRRRTIAPALSGLGEGLAGVGRHFKIEFGINGLA